MKYRTLLIDDEPLAIKRLQRILKPYEERIEIIGTAVSGNEAVIKINALKPDLIFLDIQMPELNGFEVVEHIQHQPLIIFVTAYDDYALKAFETHSIDYLLKPVDTKRMAKAIDKLQRLTKTEKSEFQSQIQHMLSIMSQPPLKRIHVKVKDRILLLELQDVYFFKAADKYVEVHGFDKNYLINKSLARLISELPVDDFVRIHRSVVINLNYVDEIVKMFKGSYQVRMKDKARSGLPLSRNMKSKLGIDKY